MKAPAQQQASPPRRCVLVPEPDSVTVERGRQECDESNESVRREKEKTLYKNLYGRISTQDETVVPVSTVSRIIRPDAVAAAGV